MAAMSLGFIVMVTPATIQEVVAACTGCKVRHYVFLIYLIQLVFIYRPLSYQVESGRDFNYF